MIWGYPPLRGWAKPLEFDGLWWTLELAHFRVPVCDDPGHPPNMSMWRPVLYQPPRRGASKTCRAACSRRRRVHWGLPPLAAVEIMTIRWHCRQYPPGWGEYHLRPNCRFKLMMSGFWGSFCHYPSIPSTIQPFQHLPTIPHHAKTPDLANFPRLMILVSSRFHMALRNTSVATWKRWSPRRG